MDLHQQRHAGGQGYLRMQSLVMVVAMIQCHLLAQDMLGALRHAREARQQQREHQGPVPQPTQQEQHAQQAQHMQHAQHTQHTQHGQQGSTAVHGHGQGGPAQSHVPCELSVLTFNIWCAALLGARYRCTSVYNAVGWPCAGGVAVKVNSRQMHLNSSTSVHLHAK